MTPTTTQRLARPALAALALAAAIWPAVAAGPRISVPATSPPPVTDGTATSGEWDGAALIYGFLDNTSRSLSARQTTVALMCDDRALYLMMQSPADAPDVAPGRMAAVLAPPEAQAAYVIAVNPVGHVEYSSGTGEGWSAECVCASRVADGVWTIEIAAPYAALAAQPLTGSPPWNADFVRDWTAPEAHASWAWRRSADLLNLDRAEMGVLNFYPDGPVARVEALGDIRGGTLDPRVRMLGRGERESVYLYYDQITAGGKTRLAALPVTVGEGEQEVLAVRRALVPPDAPEQVEEVLLWVVTRGFRRVHYASGRLPVGSWPALRLLRFDYSGSETLTAHCDLSGLPLGMLGSARVVCELVGAGGQVRTSAEAAADARELSVQMPIAGLGPGAYELRCRLSGGGGEDIASASREVVIPDASAWLGNSLGITDTVPEPFTPLEVEGRAVRPWGREYRFGPSGLPEQIVSADRELLAGSVGLELVSGGQTAAFDQAPGLRVEGTNVLVRGRATAGGLGVQCLSTVEYDGMIRVDLTVTPQAATTLDRLALSVPLRPEHARYLIHTDCSGTGNPADDRYGALPEEGWRSQFLPLVWLGDEERGLLWFCEGPAGWSPRAEGPPIEVVREGDAVVLRVTMVGAPRTLDGPASYTFGLQAGPVRPRPYDWRRWQAVIAPIPTANDYFGVVPTNLRRRPEDIARQRERGRPLLVYTFLGDTATGQPEYRYFAEQWRRAGTPGATSYLHDKVCPRSSFADFQIWNFKQGLDEFDLDGLYYDLAWPGECRNRSHGCGYLDAEGQVQPTWPIFATRELAKRTYQMFHERKPRTYFLAHISGNAICLPVTAFADYTLDGEQYAHVVRGDYIGLIPLDKMRAEFTGRQFGPVAYFLAELWHRGDHIPPQPTVNMCVLTFLHDVLVHPAFHNGTARMQFDGVWERFGAAEEGVEFLPYWSNRDLIAREPPSIEVSAWRRDGAALLAVGNLTAEPLQARLTVDWAGLGLRNVESVTDGVSGEQIAVTGGSLTVPVEGKSLRMLVAP